MLTGGAGTNTLTGSSAGKDIFRDTAADLNGDTIVNLIASDVIDFTDFAPGTTTISKVTVGATSTVLTLTSGTTSSKVTLSGVFQGNFTVAADTTGGGGTDLTFVPDHRHWLDRDPADNPSDHHHRAGEHHHSRDGGNPEPSR